MIAYRYRMYPTVGQQAVLGAHCRDARTVWNACLEQLDHWRPGGLSSPGPAGRMRQLTEARQALPWLAEGSSSVQQQALRDFEQACRNWWTGTHRRPRWRKRGLAEGFCVRDVQIQRLNRRWAQITVPKAGRVRFKLSRPLPAGKLGMARITLDGKGRWHVSIPGEAVVAQRSPTGAVVGVDRGVTNTLALSDGRMFQAPVMRQREWRRLQRLQQQQARQRKGSNRRRHTKRRIAALYQTVKDRRRDWIEVQTTRLVAEHDLIAVENLQVRNMVRRPRPVPDPERDGAFLPNQAAAKTGLNRRICQQGWSLWLQRLEQKAEASGVHVERVPAAHTSSTCRHCGHAAAGNRESQAVFHCQQCGHVQHADIHAAQNILARALPGLALTPGPGGQHGSAGTPRARGVARRSRLSGRSENHPTKKLADAA